MRTHWLAVVALAPIVTAAPLRSTLRQAGAKLGANVYTELPDGSFTSKSTIAAGVVTIQSDLSGRWKSGKLISFALTTTASGKTATIKFANGATEVLANGKTVKLPSKFAGDAFFANYHPQILRTLLAHANPGGKVSTMLIDSGTILDVQLSKKPSVQVNGQTLSSVGFELAGINGTFMAGKDGRVVALNVPSQKYEVTLDGYESALADPMAKFPELSQATMDTSTEKGVRCRLRDGIELATDIVRPKAGGKYPAILIRTPYGRASETAHGDWWARRGYVVVTQDVRGMGDSGGDWDPFVNERKDGFDAVEWVAKQDWCDGNVGMIGGSYLGYVQWAAAVEHPVALKCIIPQVSPPPLTYNIPWENGAFMLAGSVWWANIVRGKQADFGSIKALPGVEKFLTLPLSKLDDAVFGRNIPFFDKWLERSSKALWAGSTTLEEIAGVKIPTLSISGTWDGDGVGTKLHWETMRAAGTQNRWLVFGPWEHGFNVSTKHGDVDYGPDSVIDLDSVYLRFFDTFLKAKSVRQEAVRPVRLFVTGSNKWIEALDWPDPNWVEKTMYLAATKPANGATSGGLLLAKPQDDEPSRYLYNPAAVSVIPQAAQIDEAKASTVVKIEDKDSGMLTYRTASLEKATTIAGPIEATLFVASTARDATFHALILDQDEKGIMRIIGEPGTLRATYANPELALRPLTPGKIYQIDIRPWWFCHEFAKGHRLVLAVTSDLFPGFARNLGTGEPDANATRMIAAVQTVYHDPQHPSSLKYWIVTSP